MRKINKYIEFITTKIKVMIKEKKYTYKDNIIKYIFEENTSDTLIVVLSACTRVGVKARYNYNRTLNEYKVNKLFILDNFGDDKRGTFYLGKNGEFDIPQGVNSLIDYIINKCKAKKIIFIGSSKGGAAALYFGLQRESTIIIGGPQYRLGNYMNKQHHMNRFKYIMGEVNSDNILKLDKLISEQIQNSYKNSVYLQYSKYDIYYKSDIRYLVQDIKNSEIEFSCEELDYKNHDEVSLYFPIYLKKILNKIL